MDFKSIGKTLLGTIAPSVAGAIAGPGGVAAVSAVEKIFGLAPGSSTPDSLASAIAGATPEQQLELKKLELDFKIQNLQAEYADRASARDLLKVSLHDWTPKILAYLAVVSAFGMSWAMLFHTVKADSAALGMILGFVFYEARSVYSAYFSSASGNDKTS